MCIVWTRCIASTPLDTARATAAATFLVAPLAHGLRAALSTGAGPAGSASTRSATFSTGAARATAAAIRLAHSARATATTLHLVLLNRPLDNDAALQDNLNRGFRHIDRDNPALAFRRIKKCTNGWQVLPGLDVGIVFVGETAQEATAHAGNLGGIER